MSIFVSSLTSRMLQLQQLMDKESGRSAAVNGPPVRARPRWFGPVNGRVLFGQSGERTCEKALESEFEDVAVQR